MTFWTDSPSEPKGKLVVAFSDNKGSSVGVEFSSTTQKNATTIMGICASTLGGEAGKLVTSTSSSDTPSRSSGGGDNMETRLAVLEAEVSHIKNDVSDLKSKVSSIETTVNSVDKNIAVILEKLDGIKDSVSKKPSTDAVEKRISEAKLAIILSVPAIIAVGTAIYKAFMFFYHQNNPE